MKRTLQSWTASVVLASFLVTWSALDSAEKQPAKGAKPDNYKQKIPGSDLSFDMVGIPGGTFVMGSPKDEKGRDKDEGPQHPVAVEPFWMGKCEVTWDEFDLYRKEKGVENPDANLEILKKNPDAVTGPTPPYVDETYGHERDGHPALCMTHHAAMVYCQWLSEKTGKAYRLPTEAEWEYACRAGTKTTFSFGDDPAKLKDYAWYVDSSEETTHPVGTKKPNQWGLHDMYGNVMEWCIDYYSPTYYAKFPTDKVTLSPVLVPTHFRFSHVTRGGSWADEVAECRSAARRGSDVEWIRFDPQRPRSVWWLTNMDFVGFRVVRAVNEQKELKGIRSKVTRESALIADE